MSYLLRLQKLVYAFAISGAMLCADNVLEAVFVPGASLVSSAEARTVRRTTRTVVVRPGAGTVRGTVRRTTRRVIRRSTVYVAARPAGCVATQIYGTSVLRCGGRYYQRAGSRYVVVYVD